MKNLEYEIDKTARLVRLSYLGKPDFEEWAGTMRAVFSDPDFKTGFDFLGDRRSVKEAPASDYIQRVVAFFRDHEAEMGRSRFAMVVSGLETFGVGRMAQGLGAGMSLDLQVFTDMNEAKRWLGR